MILCAISISVLLSLLTNSLPLFILEVPLVVSPIHLFIQQVFVKYLLCARHVYIRTILVLLLLLSALTRSLIIVLWLLPSFKVLVYVLRLLSVIASKPSSPGFVRFWTAVGRFRLSWLLSFIMWVLVEYHLVTWVSLSLSGKQASSPFDFLIFSTGA